MLAADFGLSKLAPSFYQWFHLRSDLLIFGFLITGYGCLFYYFWKKPWGYLQEVMEAAKTASLQNDSIIELSEPLKDMEKQLNQMKMSALLGRQAVKEAESKKNELVMYLAHDIRTPLTSVIGYLSLLDEAPGMLPEQKASYVGIALKKARRLEKLINEFFEITRYHSQQIAIAREKVDLYYMLVQITDELYPVLAEKGNKVTLKADEDVSVFGDPEKLARVFTNILKNAAVYSYADTEIVIGVEDLGDTMEITFTNHGKTIPEDQLLSVFEKFSRLDEARKSDTGGAGLGLSIADEIIRLHGGSISVKSEGDTVAFTVSLPVKA